LFVVRAPLAGVSDQQEPLNRQSANIPHGYSAKSEVPTITDASGARVRDDDGLDFLSMLYCVNAGNDDRILDAMSERPQRVPYVSPSKNNDA
jgi:adenosylmethionine-8-amino-7-oxononanoate aminotransferase